MNLKENMMAKRDEFWNDEIKRLKELIIKEFLSYQEKEDFASAVYSVKFKAMISEDSDIEERIEIFAEICDCEDNLKDFYLAYCIKDVAVVQYVEKIVSILSEDGFEIINCISEFSRKEISEEMIILEAIIELD